MLFELFIARRVRAARSKSFSNIILRIAVVAIALSTAVMIAATAMVAGFKKTISEKMFGFWGHIHISSSYDHSSYSLNTAPLNAQQPYYPTLDTIRQLAYENAAGEWVQTQAGIRHIQQFATKEGIIKTADQIEGIVLRGVGSDYDWNFLRQYIVQGDTLDTRASEATNGILVSERTTKRLKLGLGDEFLVYFVQGESSSARKFKIVGIYRTGLEEYDRRFALVDIRKTQQLNNWRPFHNYGTELFLEDEKAILAGLSVETAQDWSLLRPWMREGDVFDLSDSTTNQALISQRLAAQRNLRVGDTLRLRYAEGQDTHTFRLAVSGLFDVPDEPSLQRTVFVHWQRIQDINRALPAQISGFEIFIEDIRDLDAFGEYLYSEVLLGEGSYAATIKQMEPSIFDWLNLTDTNERIITILMVLVAIINMTTALLILILERTNMIGILKALGATNWSIRRIFLYNAAGIIGWGLFWGNFIGIGFCLLQQQFGLIRLPEDLYYVSVVPIELNLFTILWLNFGTLFITLLVLILPSWLVAKVAPVKAIRFA